MSSKNISQHFIYYQNVRGLRTKMNNFYCNLLSSNFKFIGLTETNLQPSIKSQELFPDSYNVYRCDRDLDLSGKQGGGGVLLAISKEFLSSQLDNPIINGCECVWVKVSNNKGNILYISIVYFRPRSPLEVYQAYFDFVQQNNLLGNGNLAILGDFNLPIYGKDYCLNNGDSLCKELLIFLNFHDLSLKNNVFNFQSKTLDLVITNIHTVEVMRCHDQLVPEDPYHPAIEARIVIDVPLLIKSRSTESASYCFKRANFLQIYEDLSAVNWAHLYSISNVNEGVDYFYSKMHEIINKSCPLSKNKLSKYPFWFTPAIIFNLKLKEKYRRKYKKINSQENYNKFKNQRALVKREIKLAYQSYISNAENSINLDSRKFWNFVKSKKSGNSKLTMMEYNGVTLDSGASIVGAFAEYFSSVYEKYTTEPSVESAVAGPCRAGVSCLPLPQLSHHDVQSAIKKLKSKCTTGPDLLPQYLFKGCADLLVNPLTFLFNLSLNTNAFPDKWKISKVTPIFKSGKKSHIINYRPVAILSVPAKIFEVCIHKVLFSHFKTQLSFAQHGFVPGRSVTTNLLNFTGYISSGLDSGVRTDSLFLDLAKAFDKVDHLILLKKLHNCGISFEFLKFFKSYIVNRKQFIFYNGFYSSTFDVQSGVPQGSNLGPCLFTMLINDLSDYIRFSNVLLFADDLKLFKHIRNDGDVVSLQKDLDSVFLWSVVNKMSFNSSKCQVMTFTRSANYVQHNYFLNGALISRTNNIKDLGVYMDTYLSFNLHIESCVVSASKMLGFIIRLSFNFRNINTLITIYNSLVRSRLESNAIVWSPNYITYQNALESIQKRFLRFLFYKYFNIYTYEVPYGELLGFFGFRSLDSRRKLMDLVFLYKLVRGRVDDSTSLAALSYRVPTFNSRSRLLFSLPYSRTTAHASSPLCRVMRSYNLLVGMGSDLDIFHDTLRTFKMKCVLALI